MNSEQQVRENLRRSAEQIARLEANIAAIERNILVCKEDAVSMGKKLQALKDVYASNLAALKPAHLNYKGLGENVRETVDSVFRDMQTRVEKHGANRKLHPLEWVALMGSGSDTAAEVVINATFNGLPRPSPKAVVESLEALTEIAALAILAAADIRTQYVSELLKGFAEAAESYTSEQVKGYAEAAEKLYSTPHRAGRIVPPACGCFICTSAKQ